MEKMSKDDRSAQARRERNRRDYAEEKRRQDRCLLRMEKGDLAKLDNASQAIGVSRAAFLRMFLIPTLGPVVSRMGEIERSRAARGQSLSQFLAAAIEAALIDAARETDASPAADEFDALFGPPGGDD